MYDVNVELGNSATGSLGLNDANVRNLANIPSGAIGFSDLRGSFKMSMGYAYTYSTYYTLVQAQYGYYSGSYGGVTNTFFEENLRKVAVEFGAPSNIEIPKLNESNKITTSISSELEARIKEYYAEDYSLKP